MCTVTYNSTLMMERMNMDRTLLGNVHGHLKLVLNIINPSSMEGVLDLSDHISVEIKL